MTCSFCMLYCDNEANFKIEMIAKHDKPRKGDFYEKPKEMEQFTYDTAWKYNVCSGSGSIYSS